MKTIKIILLAQIILLLASCSTNNFYKRKYTKGRYFDRSTSYSPKSSKKRSVQYAQSSTKGKIKEEVVKNKKVEKTQEKIVAEKVKATKIETKNSTKALKEKTITARKLLKKTSSIPISYFKDKISFTEKSKKKILQNIEKETPKDNKYGKIALILFLISILGFLIIGLLITLTPALEGLIFSLILGTIFVLCFITAFIFLLIWLVNL